MRPPILFLTIAFGAGLYAGLDLFVVRGAWYAVVPVLGTALLVARRAPLGTALGVMGVAGLVWGMAAGREREATCAGSWSRERGGGARRDALAAKSTELFGARAPIVNALVFAPNARLDSHIRERYVRSGLAHLLSISGLHVGFIAAWLALILGKLRLAARARFGATAVLLLGYLWLLGFPAPAVRSGAMLLLADVARLRQWVVAPRGVVALAALGVLIQDAWAWHCSISSRGARPSCRAVMW